MGVYRCRAASTAVVVALASSGCGRIDFEPTTGAFEVVWDFSDPADYVYDASLIEVASGVARLRFQDLADHDGSLLGFGGGQLTSTEWSAGDNALTLSGGAVAGGFVSRVFDASTEVDWSGIAWSPAAPYRKGLLGDRATETFYASDGASMADNRLLLHLDAPSTLDGAMIVDDSGGNAHGMLAAGDATNKATPGRFGWGLHSDGVDDIVTVPAGTPVDDITVGQSAATWSFWLRRASAAAGTILYKSDNNGSRGWWIDVRAAAQDLGIGYICPMGNTRKYTANIPPPGAWFHVGITYQGLNGSPASFRFFVDGVEITTFTQADACNSPDGTAHMSDVTIPLYIGYGLDGTRSYLNGDLDEIAIWGRALSAGELRGLYLRGVRRLGLQARVCARSDCSDDPAYFGSDLEPDAQFTDTSDGRSTPKVVFAAPVRGRYAQYQLALETAAGETAPQIAQVRWAHSPESGIGNASGPAFVALSDLVVDQTTGVQGEIGFRISPDGARWYYWSADASAWAEVMTSADVAPAAVVGEHIAELAELVGPGELYFRAFMASTGDPQEVTLDRVILRGRR